MNEPISSPLVKNVYAVVQREYPAEYIIKKYKDEYDINVTGSFTGVKKLTLYTCPKTNYAFFYPFTLAGNASFYEQLEKFPWYYSPTKWEHKIVLDLLSGNEDILEVGCGNGNFLKQAAKKTSGKIIGLEINSNSFGKGNEYEIIDQSIEVHAGLKPQAYDVVCTFQVVEHITNVYDFISNQLACLKKNGRLIIAVPNNDSFIKYDKLNLLNLPPHHMGLWNEKSLRALAEIFDVQIEKCVTEPLQEIHFQWYNRVMLGRYVGITMAKVLNKLLFLIGGKFIVNYYKKKAHLIEGHTILFVYKKNGRFV